MSRANMDAHMRQIEANYIPKREDEVRCAECKCRISPYNLDPYRNEAGKPICDPCHAAAQQMVDKVFYDRWEDVPEPLSGKCIRQVDDSPLEHTLDMMEKSGPVTIARLCARMNVRRSAMKSRMETLKERGLVECEQGWRNGVFGYYWQIKGE